MSFVEQLADLRARALAALTGSVNDLASLQAWEREFLGGRGELTTILRAIGSVPADERPEAGRQANALKRDLTEHFENRQTILAAADLAQRLESDAVDVTLPGRRPALGTVHPVWKMIDEVSQIFALMGFETVFGPEV